jgi:hypothetical protein
MIRIVLPILLFFSYPLLISFPVCLVYINLPDGFFDLQNSGLTTEQLRFYTSCSLSFLTILFWTLLSYQLTPFVGVRLSPQVNSSPSTLLPNPKTRIHYFPSKAVGVTPIRLYTSKGPGVTKAQRNSIKVTQPQHEIIVGSLLGELFATKRTGPDSNTRLSLTQANLGYLLSYQTLLGPLIRQVAPTPTSKLDKLIGKTYKGILLCTMSLPCLNYYRDWFYPEGTKVVPADIGEHLTPLGLAHWFAQDGAKTTDNGVTLATLCFTDAEHQLLLNVLSTNFGLNCTVQRTGGKGQKTIYIRRASIPTFIELVRPHLHESMLYKLPTK